MHHCAWPTGYWKWPKVTWLRRGLFPWKGAQWYILYYYYSKKKAQEKIRASTRDHFRSCDFRFQWRHFRLRHFRSRDFRWRHFRQYFPILVTCFFLVLDIIKHFIFPALFSNRNVWNATLLVFLVYDVIKHFIFPVFFHTATFEIQQGRWLDFFVPLWL